ncbi:hypothetical protein CTI12_AA267090 [Artemisia annua]|uniref:Uncharacterized protein n=1 Tax=Artemisia annua TaxID=35608 RepID=A0A2U1NGZ4_ARTAN|nr:hypothetical protein CTI12_AA267090 [Artemisia annua]
MNLKDTIDFVSCQSVEKKKMFQPSQLSCFEAVIFSSLWVIWSARNEKKKRSQIAGVRSQMPQQKICTIQ